MSRKLLQMDFPYGGPFGEEMVEPHRELARDIAKAPGLIWKIWTQNRESGEAGGIYLFEDEPSLRTYLEMHTRRLAAWGITHINIKVFDIGEELTRITRGPAV